MASKHKNQTKHKAMDVSQGESYAARINVNNMEQIAAVVGGGALLLYYLRKVSLADALLIGAAGTLIYRGVTNRPLNINALPTERLTEGIQTLSERAKGWAQGWAEEFRGKIEQFRSKSGLIRVEKSIVINKSPEELYAFWRNFENLPNIMSHLESVTHTRGKRSHWVAKGPAGVPVEWDAEITEDRKNELISWRALADADVPNQGTVYFEKAGDGRTALRVSMEYTLPGGEIGAAIAEFFGEDPSQKIEDDLNNFKEAVEEGAIMLGDNAYNARGSEE